MFLQAGTRVVWLVDPDKKTVMRFYPDIAPTMLKEGDTLEGGDVLPSFTVPVTEIFV